MGHMCIPKQLQGWTQGWAAGHQQRQGAPCTSASRWRALPWSWPRVTLQKSLGKQVMIAPLMRNEWSWGQCHNYKPVRKNSAVPMSMKPNARLSWVQILAHLWIFLANDLTPPGPRFVKQIDTGWYIVSHKYLLWKWKKKHIDHAVDA